VRRVIALQYNPDTLTRTLQPQSMGEGALQAEALRLKGPAIETFKLEAEIDAADQLEFPDRNQNVVSFGVAPQLAVLEAMVNPSAAALLANKALANAGTLEIAHKAGVPAPFTASLMGLIRQRARSTGQL